MGQDTKQITIEVESKFWTVSIYKHGRYSRSIDATFTEVTAVVFCKSFNGAQSIFVAVAKPHVAIVEARREIVTKE